MEIHKIQMLISIDHTNVQYKNQSRWELNEIDVI